MARLTPEQWEQARAEYEVRGVSLGDIARRFGVSQQAASKRARKEGWKQGKVVGLSIKRSMRLRHYTKLSRKVVACPQLFAPR